jgi:hypothetical protein
MDGGGWSGPFQGGSGPHSEGMGVMGGGGWVDGPMAVSVDEGYGVQRPPLGADGSPNMGQIAQGEGQDKILATVMGWDNGMNSPRIGDF